MADLKTTTEERARLRDALEHDRLADVGATEVAAAIAVLDDLDTLLAENAKLRAVAEAARIVSRQFGDDYEARLAPLDAALAALEAP